MKLSAAQKTIIAKARKDAEKAIIKNGWQDWNATDKESFIKGYSSSCLKIAAREMLYTIGYTMDEAHDAIPFSLSK